MILKRFCSISVAFSVVLSGIAALAAAADEAVLGAYDAYRAGDAMKLARHTKKLDGHRLTPWGAYWRLALTLEGASSNDVQAFFAAHGTTYAADLLRADWLRVLGKRSAWKEFDREATTYPRDDLELRCYIWLSHVARGDDSVLAEAAPMWLAPREAPEGCAKLADTMLKRGRISITDTWMRVRVLFENGQITAAKTALGYLPKGEAPDERSLAEAARTPKRLIARLPQTLEQRAAREVAILAGVRYARENPEATAKALEGAFGERLPEKDLKYLWGRVAYEGALLHHERALRWYARAGDTRLNDEQLAWKARAALRRARWAVVRDAIDRMSPDSRQDSTWTYWYGRALAAQGEGNGARAYYPRIAGQPELYRLRAEEEAGYRSAR